MDQSQSDTWQPKSLSSLPILYLISSRLTHSLPLPKASVSSPLLMTTSSSNLITPFLFSTVANREQREVNKGPNLLLFLHDPFNFSSISLILFSIDKETESYKRKRQTTYVLTSNGNYYSSAPENSKLVLRLTP